MSPCLLPCPAIPLEVDRLDHALLRDHDYLTLVPSVPVLVYTRYMLTEFVRKGCHIENQQSILLLASCSFAHPDLVVIVSMAKISRKRLATLERLLVMLADIAVVVL